MASVMTTMILQTLFDDNRKGSTSGVVLYDSCLLESCVDKYGFSPLKNNIYDDDKNDNDDQYGKTTASADNIPKPDSIESGNDCDFGMDLCRTTSDPWNDSNIFYSTSHNNHITSNDWLAGDCNVGSVVSAKFFSAYTTQTTTVNHRRFDADTKNKQGYRNL
jgi:hypothetical protein